MMCNLTMEVKYSWPIGNIYIYVILIRYLYHSRCLTAALRARAVRYWNPERCQLTGVQTFSDKPARYRSPVIAVNQQGLQDFGGKKKRGGEGGIQKIPYAKWTTALLLLLTFVPVAHFFPKWDREKAWWLLSEVLWRKVRGILQPLLWCSSKQLQGSMRSQWQAEGERCSKFPDTVMKQAHSCKVLFASVSNLQKKKPTKAAK